MIDKIRYRLVFNRKGKLNRQGMGLVQAEALLNGRKAYFSTKVYLKPEHWSREGAQVVNHPQAYDLNAMLAEFIMHLQGVEIGYWKRGMQCTLLKLKDAVKKGISPTMPFLKFAEKVIMNSDRKPGTQENMMSTVKSLKEYRKGMEFKDIDYTFLKDYELYLKEKGLHVNTIAKHFRQLRTLVNEAINEGYMSQEDYPFRQFKIKKEKKEHNFLRKEELRKLEKMKVDGTKRHVLDAFLFCCYTGLRYSDFKQLRKEHIVKQGGRTWIVADSVKTGVRIKIPLSILFGGKGMEILESYGSIDKLTRLGRNSDMNRVLNKVWEQSGIKKRFTFHTARHTCASILVNEGVSMASVQKLLGHTSVKTTQIYSEIIDDTLIRELSKLNKNTMKNRDKSIHGDAQRVEAFAG